MAFTAQSSEKFAKHIEQRVATTGMSYMEAILEFCARHECEPESVVTLLTDKIKQALAHEAQALHLIPKMSELPLD